MRIVEGRHSEVLPTLTPSQKRCGLLRRGSCSSKEDLGRTCFTAQHCARCVSQTWDDSESSLEDTLSTSGSDVVFLCLLPPSFAEGADKEQTRLQQQQEEEEVAGCVLVQDKGSDGVWLWSVCTDSRFRRRGVATSLMRRVSERYHDRPLFLTIDSIHKRGRATQAEALVVVAERYPKLTRFYGRFGFEPVERGTRAGFMELWKSSPDLRKLHLLSHGLLGYGGLIEEEERIHV